MLRSAASIGDFFTLFGNYGYFICIDSRWCHMSQIELQYGVVRSIFLLPVSNRPRSAGYVRDDQSKAGDFRGTGSPTWRWDFTHGFAGLYIQLDPKNGHPRTVPHMAFVM